MKTAKQGDAKGHRKVDPGSRTGPQEQDVCDPGPARAERGQVAATATATATATAGGASTGGAAGMVGEWPQWREVSFDAGGGAESQGRWGGDGKPPAQIDAEEVGGTSSSSTSSDGGERGAPREDAQSTLAAHCREDAEPCDQCGPRATAPLNPQVYLVADRGAVGEDDGGEGNDGGTNIDALFAQVYPFPGSSYVRSDTTAGGARMIAAQDLQFSDSDADLEAEDDGVRRLAAAASSGGSGSGSDGGNRWTARSLTRCSTQ